jgi:hypothetical protein
MIGKGAQYLTAAGFGRYRITAASLGSLVMLGKFWLTAATKQAIMDAFGVDGPAVIAATNEYLNGIAASDKAKATALAGFINTYAVEDAYVVVSIIPTTGYVRSIVTDGSAKFALGYKYTTDMTLELDCTPATIANETCFLTNGNWAGNTPLWIIYQSTIRWHIASGGSVDWNGTVSANTRYDINVGNGYVEVNGSRTTKGDGSYSSNANLILFGLSISTGTSRSFIGKAHSLKVNGTSHDEWWVPFIRNNVKGWLDVKSDTFMAPSCGTIDITVTPPTP